MKLYVDVHIKYCLLHGGSLVAETAVLASNSAYLTVKITEDRQGSL